jgi:hypothetical protein
MELCFTKKQILSLLEQDATADPAAQAPTAGTSDKQAGGQGYPEVGKWESGIERGPANQVGVTKWADVVGSKLKRGKANTLKEQSSYEKGIWDRSTKMINKFPEKVNQHDVNMVLGIAAVFIPFVGPLLAAGIGLIDAKQYYDEGNTKTAGMVAMFALLPGIGKVVSLIPGVKTLGPKLMAELGKKLSLGSKSISPAEIEVVSKISKYKELITAEIKKVGEAAAKQNVKKQLVKQAVKQKVKQKATSIVPTAAAYTTAGVAYSKGYDKIVGNPKAQDYVNRVTNSTEPPVSYKQEDMILVDGVWEIKQ